MTHLLASDVDCSQPATVQITLVSSNQWLKSHVLTILDQANAGSFPMHLAHRAFSHLSRTSESICECSALTGTHDVLEQPLLRKKIKA